MEEWKASFRDIYKRSPTASDIAIAPKHVKDALQGEKKQELEKKEEKQVKKGVKRKNFEMRMMDDEQFSPVKKRVNLKKTEDFGDDVDMIALRTSPRKKVQPLGSSQISQNLQNSQISPIKRLGPIGIKNFSPVKKFQKNFSPLKSPSMSPRKRLAGPSSHVDLNDFSPMKSFSASTSKSASKCSLTPIKSPTKRAYQRQLFNRDLESLLMPTPEKFEGEEEVPEEFGDETNEEVAKARAHKPAARRLGPVKDQNFQKINLRKKQFVRGKVTAEQKRKLKRKQMFKKK